MQSASSELSKASVLLEMILPNRASFKCEEYGHYNAKKHSSIRRKISGMATIRTIIQQIRTSFRSLVESTQSIRLRLNKANICILTQEQSIIIGRISVMSTILIQLLSLRKPL